MTNINMLSVAKGLPPEVVEAAARAMHADWVQGFLDEDETSSPSDHATWSELDEVDLTFYLSQARAAVIAALNAWPGGIILPIEEDSSNADG